MWSLSHKTVETGEIYSTTLNNITIFQQKYRIRWIRSGLSYFLCVRVRLHQNLSLSLSLSHTHTHTHTHTYTHAHTHTHTHTHTLTLSLSLSLTHTHTQTLIHSYTNISLHLLFLYNTHTHTHTHTCVRVHTYIYRKCPPSSAPKRSVAVKVLNCDIVVNEYELQSRSYVYFRTNALWEMCEPPYPPPLGYGLNSTTTVLRQECLWY